MQINVTRRLSDYATYIPKNSEEFKYAAFPNVNTLTIPNNELTEIIPYYTYAPDVEYFFLFELDNNTQFLENFYRRLLFFRRTAGLLLPIGEVFYHYQHTKNLSYSNLLQNISSMYVQNQLAIKLNTKANPSLPKNDEALLVYSTHSLNLKYRHSGEKLFSSRRTNFFVPGGRNFVGDNLAEVNISDILKNYDIVVNLPQ